MTHIDPRLLALNATVNEREPTDVYADQFAVVIDNLMSGYLRDPSRTDAMLRRDGMTKTADRFRDLFGPNWGELLPRDRPEPSHLQ